MYPTDYVVITGGEPMIAKGIHELMKALKKKDKHITIETAATVLPNGILCDLASLSPKLSNSTPELLGWTEKHEKRRLQPDVIAEWINFYRFQLKFVVSTEREIDEIVLLVKMLPGVERQNIWLMPEGTDMESIHSRSMMVSDMCKSLGWRYCQRLQIDLYGNTKGT
jgi:7-carboxy-7-deazaguanine synthase